MENKKTNDSYFKRNEESRNESNSASFREDRSDRGNTFSENRRRSSREGGSQSERPRRSFNPNFTRDNKLVGNNSTGQDRSSFGGERKSYGDRPERSGNSFGGERKSYGDRPERSGNSFGGERRSYGDRPERSGNSFGGERRSYGDRPERGGSRYEGRDNRGGKFGEERVVRNFKPTEDMPEQSNFTNVIAELKKGEIRLNRYVAMSGVCSRREADELILSGKVTVDDVVVTEMGTRVDINSIVKYEDKIIRGERNVYIIMNKPKDYVTTLEDKNCKYIVTDLLGGNVKERIYPVGRLDKNSMGVLLMTNDGELTKILTHPSYNKKKIYHVYIDRDINDEDMEKLTTGIELEDGLTFVDEISIVEGNRKEVGVEIHSGKNRVVRRMFESMGYKVRKLDRVYFAGLTKKGLQRGEWRYLTTQEVEELKKTKK